MSILCRRITGNRDDRFHSDVVVAFGAGSFSSTSRGNAPAPVKGLYRELRRRCYVGEHRTSKVFAEQTVGVCVSFVGIIALLSLPGQKQHVSSTVDDIAACCQHMLVALERLRSQLPHAANTCLWPLKDCVLRKKPCLCVRLAMQREEGRWRMHGMLVEWLFETLLYFRNLSLLPLCTRCMTL